MSTEIAPRNGQLNGMCMAVLFLSLTSNKVSVCWPFLAVSTWSLIVPDRRQVSCEGLAPIGPVGFSMRSTLA